MSIKTRLLCITLISMFCQNALAQHLSLMLKIDTITHNTPIENAYPNYSPDGTKIVFQSNVNGNRDIFVMDRDGKNPKQLTNNPASDMMPVWSPDGKKIAFVSNRDEKRTVDDLDGNTEIYVMNADGSNQINVSKSSGRDIHPNWFPDGKKLLINSTRHNSLDVMEHEFHSFELYALDLKTLSAKRLTTNEFVDTYASVSPDGKKIAFRRQEDEDNSEIYIMDVSGKNEINLTKNASFDGWPAWSHTGKYILFSSDRTDNINMFVMKADGSHVTNVTNNEFYNSRGNWSKKDNTIVFNIQSEKSFGIYSLAITEGLD